MCHRLPASAVELEGRRTKAEEVVEVAPGQRREVESSRMSARFGLGEGLPVGQCRFGCSRLRLRDNVVLRMQLGT